MQPDQPVNPIPPNNPAGNPLPGNAPQAPQVPGQPAQPPAQPQAPQAPAPQPAQEGVTPQASPPAQDNDTKNATPEQSRQELQQAIQGSTEVLATATTALRIFPDTFTLDRAKLTVTRRTFFSSADVMSIRIEDVLNIAAQVGPLFGSLKVTSRIMSADKPYEIHGFWRKDAIRLKRVTQGYIIALQRHIDCSSLPSRELARKLEQLGEDDHSNI